MPFIRSSVSKRRAHVVEIIILLGEIMPSYSYYIKKGLVYIAIMALANHQPSFYTKYTKLNIRSSCDVRLVFDTECAFLAYYYRY